MFRIISTFLSASIAFGMSLSTRAATGFEGGNDFSASWQRGQVFVSYTDGGSHENATFICDTEDFSPALFARFVTDAGNGADEVELFATHADGSTRDKKKDFDAATGASRGEFNLWIHTLLQRPLLEDGANVVRFQLTRKGDVVASGEFVAHVERLSSRRCESGRVQSFRIEDCRDRVQACRKYWQSGPSCR